MEIKKTIQRLKKENNAVPAAAPVSETPALVPPDECRPQMRPGWYSPDYCRSRKVALDPHWLAENRIFSEVADSADADTYKVLKTQIQQRTMDKGWNSIMVTSPGLGEGKTLTAINLAMAFAKDFDRTVLLVDCDLKCQKIHKYLGIDGEVGLIDYLLNDRPLSELIVWPGIEKLTLMSGGQPIDESTELLGSPRMRQLVEEMKTRYENRYIIYDVPPLLNRSDTLAFAPLVDGIVVVVKHGITALPDINQALALIPRGKIVGFVLNGSEPKPAK